VGCAAGWETTGADDATARLLCMVNPTNPTGDYMPVEQVRHHVLPREYDPLFGCFPVMVWMWGRPNR
jgi:hypothetical protein